MELMILLLVSSFQEGDFHLYCEALSKLLSYFFANNNVHYARWLSVQFTVMMNLESSHPAIAQEFRKGNFVAIEHCHCP